MVWVQASVEKIGLITLARCPFRPEDFKEKFEKFSA